MRNMTTYHRITSGDDLASLVGREQPENGWNVEIHGKVEGRDSRVERKPPTQGNPRERNKRRSVPCT